MAGEPVFGRRGLLAGRRLTDRTVGEVGWRYNEGYAGKSSTALCVPALVPKAVYLGFNWLASE
jgi:hypothetical protein